MTHVETVPPTQAGSEVHPAVMALAHAIRREIIEVARTEPRRGALQHYYRFTRGAHDSLAEADLIVDGALDAVVEATF